MALELHNPIEEYLKITYLK